MHPQLIAGFAAFSLLAGTAAGATIIKALPQGDGYFHDETGSSWDFFDAATTSNNVLYTYYGTSDTMRRDTSYVQFDLGQVAPGSNIGDITLYINLTGSHYQDESPSAGFVRHVANSGGANGNASQRLGGTELVVEIKDQSTGWLALDVTAYVQNDIASGYPYSCFSFEPNTAGYFRNAGFSFTSADSPSEQPYLLIAVPEPSALAIALAGAGLALLRRRR